VSGHIAYLSMLFVIDIINVYASTSNSDFNVKYSVENRKHLSETIERRFWKLVNNYIYTDKSIFTLSGS